MIVALKKNEAEERGQCKGEAWPLDSGFGDEFLLIRPDEHVNL
jgi:hypothetical protein